MTRSDRPVRMMSSDRAAGCSGGVSSSWKVPPSMPSGLARPTCQRPASSRAHQEKGWRGRNSRGACAQPQANTSTVAWRSQDERPARTNRAPSISGITTAAGTTPCRPSWHRLPSSTLAQEAGSRVAGARPAQGPRTSMARRRQSAARRSAAGLSGDSARTATSASVTSARLPARSVALIPASWPPPSNVSATAPSSSSPEDGAARDRRTARMAGGPVRSMRMLRPGLTGMSSQRALGGGTADKRSTRVSYQPPSPASRVSR